MINEFNFDVENKMMKLIKNINSESDIRTKSRRKVDDQ